MQDFTTLSKAELIQLITLLAEKTQNVEVIKHFCENRLKPLSIDDIKVDKSRFTLTCHEYQVSETAMSSNS